MSEQANMTGRKLSVGAQFTTLLRTQVRLLFMAKRTRAMFFFQLLPVLAGLFFVVFGDVDGLNLFSGLVELVILPWLVPLAAIFFGGPAIVEELEQRTLTYLTLRPVPKPALYVGKVVAAMIVALPVVLVPLLLLFLVCLGASADWWEAAQNFAKTVGAISLGTVTYTSVFAMLGAMFASGLLASIVFFVFFEVIIGLLPVLEMASVRFYIRTTAEMISTDPGILYRLVKADPVVLDWYYGVAILIVLVVAALGVGAWTFKERQYHV